MPATWARRGPVSTPSAGVAYLAGGIIVAVAVAGAGLGFSAAWRPSSEPGLNDHARPGAHGDILDAKPIVDLTPATAAPAESGGDSDAEKADDGAKDRLLAAQTAGAQANQAKAAGSKGDIDQINTPADEKPPAPVKAPADEAPPNAPVRSDVPF